MIQTCRHGRNLNIWTCSMRGIEVVHDFKVPIKKHTKRGSALKGLMGTKGAPTPPRRISNVVSGGLPGTGKKR